MHQRGRKTPLNRVPVEITLRIDARRVGELVERLEEKVIVRSVDEVTMLESTFLLLIGHIIHTDLSDTITRVDSSDAECVEIFVSMPRRSEASTALLTIAARSKEALSIAVARLKEVCARKGIEVIDPIDGDFV